MPPHSPFKSRSDGATLLPQAEVKPQAQRPANTGYCPAPKEPPLYAR
ncbi:MAG TPA: hypothetical protein VFW25_11355 [Silvibacterium sp.]|nr:hypothetical protein [Silvibacterium sp.]